MIFTLLKELKKDPSLKIIALSLNEGILVEKLREAGIDVSVISEKEHAFPAICFKAFRLLKGRKIDVIHSHRYKENLIALFFGKFVGAKRLVTTLHGLPEPLYGNVDGRAKWTAKINHFLTRHFFTSVVAVSHDIKKTLVDRYHFDLAKVEVIHNGLEMPKQSPAVLARTAGPRQFHIGTVGRMVPVKDFALFLKIVAEIGAQMKNVRFSILGEGPLKEELVQRAKILRVDDCVDFFSPVTDPFPYYRSLDIYLNTSLHEGIPMSILEAMACGVPVVAPKVGGIPEIISDEVEGVLIEGREPKGFVQACVKLVKNGDLRAAMGKSGLRRIASHFGSAATAASYRKVYEG